MMFCFAVKWKDSCGPYLCIAVFMVLQRIPCAPHGVGILSAFPPPVCTSPASNKSSLLYSLLTQPFAFCLPLCPGRKPTAHRQGKARCTKEADGASDYRRWIKWDKKEVPPKRSDFHEFEGGNRLSLSMGTRVSFLSKPDSGGQIAGKWRLNKFCFQRCDYKINEWITPYCLVYETGTGFSFVSLSLFLPRGTQMI